MTLTTFAMCAHSAGITVEKDWEGFGPSSKYSQPGTVSLEMWFYSAGLATAEAMLVMSSSSVREKYHCVYPSDSTGNVITLQTSKALQSSVIWHIVLKLVASLACMQ